MLGCFPKFTPEKLTIWLI